MAAKYRSNLPQVEQSDKLFVTDSGIETVLIFDYKLDLPQFAAFKCLEEPKGRDALDEYFLTHAKLAAEHKVSGIILDTCTWRASKDWAAKVGEETNRTYSDEELIEVNQQAVKQLVEQPGLILVAGRYEGIDERIIETEVDEEWSIGDYVLSGGELAALVMIDAVARMIPGVLGDVDSAAQDSFMKGLLDCPHYTRPEEIDGLGVPEVLLGGNHQAIEKWRMKQALGRTWLRRPELLNELTLSDEQQQLLQAFQEELRSALEKRGL